MKIRLHVVFIAAALCILTAGHSVTPSAASAAVLNPGVESPFIAVAEAVRDTVVYITGDHEIEFRSPKYGERRKFRGPSAGSGFIFRREDKTVYILTNNHVIDSAKTIEVTLSDHSQYRARVMGGDGKTDLAVITVETDRPVKIAELGDSDKLRLGAWALAIGNPFPATIGRDKSRLVNIHDRTLTVGVVGGKGRSHLDFGKNAETPVFQDYIQTDAAINSGNSGGPLFDIHGRVIGVNAAALSLGNGNIGIGFAIPVNIAKKIADDLIVHGRVLRAYLGIVPQEIDEDLAKYLGLENTDGVLVARVTDDTPAGKAGLEKGDVIIEFDGKPVSELNKFKVAVAEAEIGKKTEIGVLRKGEKLLLTAELREYEDKDLVTPIKVPTSAHWLGINVKEKKKEGLLVVDIEEYSPAYQSKLRKGDIILEVNGEVVKDWEDYKKISRKLKDEKHIVFYIKRGGNNRYVGVENY